MRKAVDINHAWRKFKNGGMISLAGLAVLLAVVPLFMIFFYTLSRGIGSVNLESGGGMANALVGSGILVGLGCVFGLPVGIMAGIYLAEFGQNKFGMVVRFMMDVMSGIPSIVVGVVAYILVVLPMGHFSALAGGVALALLMIPTVTRTTEEMLRLVPDAYREAALALGVQQWKASVRVILPAAMKGITTGLLLAIARAAGETAPLLFTALGNRFWSTSIGQPIASLTVIIYDYAKAPFDDWNRQAWAAAFVLIALIFVVNLLFRYFTRDKYGRA
jgi:phosphate transport system permease protein